MALDGPVIHEFMSAGGHRWHRSAERKAQADAFLKIAQCFANLFP
jgi:hypothetical protein